jgi:hypothetical protein
VLAAMVSLSAVEGGGIISEIRDSLRKKNAVRFLGGLAGMSYSVDRCR